MYCSNCGSQVKAELNYCSRCGMRVAKNESAAPKSVAENLSSAIGYIGCVGLFGFIFVVMVLVKNGVHPAVMTFISLFYLASLFGICLLILHQLKNPAGKPDGEKTDFQDAAPNQQLNRVNTAQLEAPPEPVMSVTDTTTKTLDEVFIKRR